VRRLGRDHLVERGPSRVPGQHVAAAPEDDRRGRRDRVEDLQQARPLHPLDGKGGLATARAIGEQLEVGTFRWAEAEDVGQRVEHGDRRKHPPLLEAAEIVRADPGEQRDLLPA